MMLTKYWSQDPSWVKKAFKVFVFSFNYKYASNSVSIFQYDDVQQWFSWFQFSKFTVRYL